MNYELVYASEAQIEAKEVFEYYEMEKAGLGEEFMIELDRVFGQIKNNPKIFQKVKGDIRRGLLKKFPYGVFYKVLDEELFDARTVLIAGIYHQRSNPSRWPE